MVDSREKTLRQINICLQVSSHVRQSSAPSAVTPGSQTNGDNQNFGSGLHGVPSLDSGKSIPVSEPPRNRAKGAMIPEKKRRSYESRARLFYVKKK